MKDEYATEAYGHLELALAHIANAIELTASGEDNTGKDYETRRILLSLYTLTETAQKKINKERT